VFADSVAATKQQTDDELLAGLKRTEALRRELASLEAVQLAEIEERKLPARWARHDVGLVAQHARLVRR
jgi:hypothetical protein